MAPDSRCKENSITNYTARSCNGLGSKTDNMRSYFQKGSMVSFAHTHICKPQVIMPALRAAVSSTIYSTDKNAFFRSASLGILDLFNLMWSARISMIIRWNHIPIKHLPHICIGTKLSNLGDVDFLWHQPFLLFSKLVSESLISHPYEINYENEIDSNILTGHWNQNN